MSKGQSDANDTQRDGLPDTQGLPSGDGGSQPSDQPQALTLTQEEFNQKLDEAVRQRHGTLDTQVMNLTKQVEQLRTASSELESAKQTIQRLEQERDQRELDSAKANPDLYDAIKQRQEAARLRREAEARDAEVRSRESSLAEREKTFTESQRSTLAKVLSTETGVNEKLLLRYGGSTEAEMREYAKDLAEATGVKPGEAGNKPPTNPNPRPASQQGPGATPLSFQEQNAHELEEAKRK